ncbi:MAG: DUF58 domain-containing protein [Bacteroidetes bacterium]|nr:DUF58 domain-containing protein [Bacteroidota bacterium]
MDRLADLIADLPLRLKAARVVEGYLTGIHDSPFHGFSADFAQHRPYQPGDDLRHFDWKVWARKEKAVVRQYEEETNLQATLILDASASMSLTHDGRSKWEYAAVLAGSLIHLILRQRDAAGLMVTDETIRSVQFPRGAAWIEPVLFKTLETVEPSGKTRLAIGLEQAARQQSRRGLFILISDFMEDPDQFIPALRQLASHGHDLMAVQVLTPGDLELEPLRDVWAEDSETGERLATHWVQLAGDFKQQAQAWQTDLGNKFRNLGIDWVAARTDQPFATTLRSILQHRQR